MKWLGLDLIERVIVSTSTSRRHFDVLSFICHLFDQSVSFWMFVCSMLWSAGESLYKQSSHQQKIVCWSELCQ